MNKETFIRELIHIAGVSREYADAAWSTLTDGMQNIPRTAASDYAHRYHLVERDLDQEAYFEYQKSGDPFFPDGLSFDEFMAARKRIMNEMNKYGCD